MTGCPGRDRITWTEDDIFDVACPRCAAAVEFFKDDIRRVCPSCGLRFSNPKLDVGCAEWCAAAEKCSVMGDMFVVDEPAEEPSTQT